MRSGEFESFARHHRDVDEKHSGGTSPRLCQGRGEVQAMRFRAAEPGAHISRLRASRRLGSYQPASRQPPVCGECAAGLRKGRRVRVALRTVKQPPNRGLTSAGFAPAAGLR